VTHPLTITIPKPGIADIAKARELMERHLDEVKRVTDSIRARHARKALQDQFPEHALAVFARTWETDEYYLMQLLAPTEAIADINFDEDDVSGLTSAQKDAVSVAEDAICAIGSDDAIWEHLGMSDDEHEGWYEFDLALDDGADLTDAPVSADETTMTRETK